MAVKKGDIIDEHKRHPESCGLMVKVMGGGEGFQKIVCCGHELTEEDVVAKPGSTHGRKRDVLLPGIVLDEKTLYPDSCGLRVMIMEGGAGFKEIICCGHSLTLNALRDIKFGGLRGSAADRSGESGPTGNA